MGFLGLQLSEAKKILTVYHISNILLSIAFFAIKMNPFLCSSLFRVERDQCVVDRRESETLVFLGIMIVWRKRKAVNWLHYLSSVFLYSKLANLYLFSRLDVLVGTLYSFIILACAVFCPEPVFKGNEVITYFEGSELHDEIEKHKNTTWLVQFYTTWSAESKHVSPVFSALSEKYHLPNLRFAKLDIGRFPKEAERFRINIHPASKQLPTISLFENGKEVLRRPMIRNKRALPYVFTENNIVLDYDLNNIYNECKGNLSKRQKQSLQKEVCNETSESEKKTQ